MAIRRETQKVRCPHCKVLMIGGSNALSIHEWICRHNPENQKKGIKEKKAFGCPNCRDVLVWRGESNYVCSRCLKKWSIKLIGDDKYE